MSERALTCPSPSSCFGSPIQAAIPLLVKRSSENRLPSDWLDVPLDFLEHKLLDINPDLFTQSKLPRLPLNNPSITRDILDSRSLLDDLGTLEHHFLLSCSPSQVSNRHLTISSYPRLRNHPLSLPHRLSHSTTASMSEELSYSDVSSHSTKKDLYVVIHDKVYNASTFIDEHP